MNTSTDVYIMEAFLYIVVGKCVCSCACVLMSICFYLPVECVPSSVSSPGGKVLLAAILCCLET